MNALARLRGNVVALSGDDDESLLLAWREGDRDAGERLFDRHFAALARFFRNKTSQGMDDLVQATMLRVLESKDAFRGDGSFRSFLFGIAYNVLGSHLRQAYRTDNLDLSNVSLCDLGPGPSRAYAEKAEHRLLLEGLRAIPIEHQALLELYYWEPMTAAEIALVFELPEGTVRTRVRRAKALLEEAMRALAKSPRVLDSTLTRLDDWARSVREFSG